jgi:hypothetical protein
VGAPNCGATSEQERAPVNGAVDEEVAPVGGVTREREGAPADSAVDAVAPVDGAVLGGGVVIGWGGAPVCGVSVGAAVDSGAATMRDGAPDDGTAIGSAVAVSSASDEVVALSLPAANGRGE